MEEVTEVCCSQSYGWPWVCGTQFNSQVAVQLDVSEVAGQQVWSDWWICVLNINCLIMWSTSVAKLFSSKCCHLTMKGLFPLCVCGGMCVRACACVCLKCSFNSKHDSICDNGVERPNQTDEFIKRTWARTIQQFKWFIILSQRRNIENCILSPLCLAPVVKLASDWLLLTLAFLCLFDDTSNSDEFKALFWSEINSQEFVGVV